MDNILLSILITVLLVASPMLIFMGYSYIAQAIQQFKNGKFHDPKGN